MIDERKDQAPVSEEHKQIAQNAGIEADIKRTSGQRTINAIWESTQALIATSVTLTTLYVAARLALDGQKVEAAFLLLSNSFFLVVGFYFGRTNHQRTGGVGSKDLGR